MRELTVAPEAVRPYLESYGRMLLIRLFEQEMHRLFLKGEVHGTTHLAAGQEAIPVGVCQALRPDDYAAGTYRGHGTHWPRARMPRAWSRSFSVAPPALAAAAPAR
jgi:TPP-dependent pyruvate/acetoin dehydrogenase alpha subunit